ncbi:MAG: hypothetical protein GKR89_13845 [Candidatus Latescibacteria bacterium]|nr:hypothetical protein [Candidatus Latescibacterota bacterium]
MPQTLPSWPTLPWAETSIDRIAADFTHYGLVAIQGLLPAAAVQQADQFADELLTQLDERPWAAGQDYCRRFDIWTKVFSGLEDEVILALFNNDPVEAITEALAGADATAGGFGSWVTPRDCGQAWHQDSWSDDPALFILNRIAFTRDYTPQQGQLLVVPGSHRQGDLPAGQPYESLPGQVALTPRANTVVFLHTRTFHCVGKNQTDAPRIQFNRRAVPRGVPADLTARARFRNGTWDFKTQAPWK